MFSTIRVNGNFRPLFRSAMWISGLVMIMLLAHPCGLQAQTPTTLYAFTGGSTGANPVSLVIDSASGGLFVAVANGGQTTGNCPEVGCGVVLRMKPQNGGYIEDVLYTFTNGANGIKDGAHPQSALVYSSSFGIYGTTAAGRGGDCVATGSSPTYEGCGTVYWLQPNITPPMTSVAPWNWYGLYAFSGGSDGSDPSGNIVIDSSNDVFGATRYGGSNSCGSSQFGCGMAYKLTNQGHTTPWPETILWNFGNSSTDGIEPVGGLSRDSSGNLYGTTVAGGTKGPNNGGNGNGNNYGTVFELSSPNWTESILNDFQSYEIQHGNNFYPVPPFPLGGLLLAPDGNLYGGTAADGQNGGGTIFDLTFSNGSWTYNPLQQPTGNAWNVVGPRSEFVTDGQGNFYFAETTGGNGFGAIVKMTCSGGSCNAPTVLYSFCSQANCSDGAFPSGALAIDSSGNLYGVTYAGGNIAPSCTLSDLATLGCGLVYKFTP